MLFTASFLESFCVFTGDESVVGKVGQFFFDDRTWAVEQMSVRTGEWLGRKEILAPTAAVVALEDVPSLLRLSLSARSLARCPEAGARAQAAARQENTGCEQNRTTPLLGAGEVVGSYIRAPDGWAGRAEDLLINVGSWRVSHMVVDTASWWPG